MDAKHNAKVRAWLKKRMQTFAGTIDKGNYTTKELLGMLSAIAKEGNLRLKHPKFPSVE